MKYPRIPEELDNRRKLTSDQIEVIKKLYLEGGWTHRKLANEFRVSKTIIRYHLVDQEKRNEINKYRYKKLVEQESLDPEVAKRNKEQTRKSYKNCLKKSLKKRIYKGKATYKWKKTKYHIDEVFRNKIRKQSREKYYRDKINT